MKATLPVGNYTYVITTSDPLYTGTIEGSFSVESKTKIVLPEAAAGTAGTAYTIPDASVTVDGAVQEGEKATCTATFVQGLNGKKSEQVESGFVPLTAGTLTVVYSYAGAASQTLTVEIAAAQPAGNVVFDPSTATNENFTSTNGIQVYEAVKGEEGAAYEGDYIRITATASSWTNTRLTLGLTDESYAEYDKIGVWVYYAATGTVASSLFNDDNYKVQYAPNEWHLVLVDRDAFVEKMTGSQKDLLALAFTVNGVTGSATNFPGLTEVRIGAIVALKSFDEAEVSPIDSVNEGENASVTITVNEDVQSLTAVIKNAEGIEQQVTVEGKTVKATLPVGNYTYVIRTDDPLYTGTIEGSFSVESKTQIVLPDVTDFHIPAMEEYAIPEAGITVDGALQDGVKANMTAVFTPAYGGGAEENITDSTFTPASSGELVITYTYAGAAVQQLTIFVDRAENTTGALLDMRNADVLADVSTNITDAGKSTQVSYNAEENILVWTDVNSSSSGAWPTLAANFRTTNQELLDAGIAYLKVEVYYETAGSADPSGFFCNQKFQLGSTAVKTGADNIPRNSWYTVYIPVEYLTDAVLCGQGSLIQTKFGTAGDWRFDNVQEVRLKGFVPVTEEEIPDGMFVDMETLGADSVADVFGVDNGTQLSYAPATEAERAYLSWTAGESTGAGAWCNLSVKQLATYNAHDLYDYIAVELYYVGDADKTISWYFMAGGCTANTGSGDRLTTNEWITVYIPVEQYFGIYKTSTSSVSPAGGTGYFTECVFDSAGSSHYPNISEVRIGNIFFTNTAGSAATDYVFTANA